MAIFTALATAILPAALAGTFAVTALSGALAMGASLGLSYLQKAVSGEAEQQQERFSVQGKLQAGGTVPRSFNLGYSVTAGSLVYANTWGIPNGTPNALLTQVIALSDLPGGELLDVFVNGEPVTLGADDPGGRGLAVTEYHKEGYDYLWIKYYDGTQTTADPLCVNVVGSADRPYPSTRVGVGVAYVVVTALVEEKLFTGFPTFRFAVSGAKLYDPSKDSTVEGGSGSHRYSDPSTWGGDGDDLPVVQIYNLLRGINVNGQWLYGLQGMSAARLPTVNWIPQIDKCRALIDGESGQEPTYRSGGQINVNADLGSAIESLLSACQGRLSEIGGFYKIHVGAPGSPTFSWTDADLLSTEEQVYRPFFALADSINGVQATYPDPAQGWNMATAPPYPEDPDTTPEGGRRLMASPTLNFVPYRAQVQRLQKSVLLEAQRARTHVLPFPPAFWLVEPGDVGAWTSVRNGYEDKLFRVDGVVDQPNLDVSLYVTEVDPSDYDWDGGEFVESAIGPTVFPRPAPQGIVDWYAEGVSIDDEDGLRRRPAIRLSWDGDMPGVVGVAFQVRNKWDQVVVHRGQVPEMGFAAGAVIISQNILPNTEYQAQGQYIPSAPRDMIPSEWLDVTTPNDLVGLVEFDAAVAHQVTVALDRLQATQDRAEQLLASLGSINTARNWVDKTEVRREFTSITGAANARITEVFTVATNLEAALAQTELELEASIGAANAQISITNTALSDLSSAVTSQITALNSSFGSVSASLSSEITTRANADSAISAQITNYIAQTNNSFAAVNSQLIAQSDYMTSLASFATTLSTTVNGQSASITQLTGSIDGNMVQWGLLASFSGAPGGGLVFTGLRTATGATYTLHYRGEFIVDGTIISSKIAAGQIDAIHMKAGSITAANAAIDFLAVKTLNIGDNAVTVMQFDAQPGLRSGNYIATGTYQQVAAIAVSVDTTGMAGKLFNLLLVWNAQQFSNSGNGVLYRLVCAGSVIANAPFHVPFNGFATISLSGTFRFTGTGGVVSFTAEAQWNADSGSLSQSVLSSVVGKR